MIRCDGNDRFEMMPPDMMDSPDRILWSLTMYHNYDNDIKDRLKEHGLIVEEAMEIDEEWHRLDETLDRLRLDVEALLDERPSRYIWIKDRTIEAGNVKRLKLKKLGRGINRTICQYTIRSSFIRLLKFTN